MKSFIKLGKFSIKLLYPLICLGISILESFAENNWYSKRRGNISVSLFINSIAKVLDIFIYIPLKFFYYNSQLIEQVDEYTRKKRNRLIGYIKIFVLFFFIQIVYWIIYIIYYVQSRMEKDERKKTKESIVYLAHSYGIFFLENIQIIFIFFITKFFFKYEYIGQCIISLILFTIFSIIIDVINYNNFFYALGGFGIFMLIFICLILESVLIIYQKFIMEKLFFSPFLANFLFGIIDLLVSIILGMITYFKDGWFCNTEKKTCYLANFTDYFEDFGRADIISFFASIAFKMVIYILNMFTIYYLTPNHMLLIYIVGKFIENAISAEENIAANYILFAFLLISFILYIEIFELDFCGINHNTKQSIESRARTESEDNNKLLYKLTSTKNEGNDDLDGSFSIDSGRNSSPSNDGIDGYKF